ncbi:PH domain-containing protein [Cognatilysobacter bugurensis]|uniref:Membrane protein n=1 Tax=Cognatilysobacter bugurensis TaxID=543356 RepID=A0A918WA92_9GAMM|nr:PH domain-containing protein [Lysobacter bugurensis]GHA82648.1 membrane protein [Lysobacter bugurensis]
MDSAAPEAVPTPDAPLAPDDPLHAGWQPLPPRARALFVLSVAPSFAVPALAAGFVLGHLADQRVLGAGIGVALGAAFGLWLGLRQFDRLQWQLDESGLAVRRGRLWQRETRVPATRVQHLDLKRGPLQRKRSLATLVVHTAGTRHGAVTVPHLDGRDAEALRERLSRQIDDDGA